MTVGMTHQNTVRRGRRGIAPRFLLIPVLLGLSALSVLESETVREFEAATVARLLEALPGVHGATATTEAVYGASSGGGFAWFRITPECTSALLSIPLLLLTALLLLRRHVRLLRVCSAALLSLLLLCSFNQLRLLLVALASLRWQQSGYEWSHLLVGSVLSLIGVASAVGVLLRLSMGPRTKRNAGDSHAQ